ncbi:hypothetical protein SPSIL_042660 [Sporomusa silvacetica DSM 10669]|uniref:Uncharacterized protein n=1 Tax=Sporomusa silvacetica DSM 10669 TaxID=1123289 RepID=A0ABZ3IQU6_9FIRM|nr:hypothetical protein SPSIL_13950 [Sporomusa silvacetica DSM 10669]
MKTVGGYAILFWSQQGKLNKKASTTPIKDYHILSRQTNPCPFVWSATLHIPFARFVSFVV